MLSWVCPKTLRNPAMTSQAICNLTATESCPINPTIDEVLGEKAYKSLLDLPEELKRQIDVVDIFRRAEDVPPIVEEAIELHTNYGHPTAVWMQLGIVNEDAAKRARAAGLDVVMDHCMKIEHSRLQPK